MPLGTFSLHLSFTFSALLSTQDYMMYNVLVSKIIYMICGHQEAVIIMQEIPVSCRRGGMPRVLSNEHFYVGVEKLPAIVNHDH